MVGQTSGSFFQTNVSNLGRAALDTYNDIITQQGHAVDPQTPEHSRVGVPTPELFWPTPEHKKIRAAHSSFFSRVDEALSKCAGLLHAFCILLAIVHCCCGTAWLRGWDP